MYKLTYQTYAICLRIIKKGENTVPRNKYPEETVKKILDVSLKLFIEKGYEKTTVLDIVANLGGLTRGAFYHHFKSKEEVIEAIFSENAGSEMHPFMWAENAKVANGLERAKLALKGALLANIENEKQAAISYLAISLMSNSRFLVEKMKGDRETALLLEPMIAEGMADGSIKQGEPRLLAEMFILLANFWMIPSAFPCNEKETLAKVEMIKETFDRLGFPIIDDEIEEIFKKVFFEIFHKALSENQ